MSGSRISSLTPSPSRGFTLIELLVALAVFAVVAVLAYGGLNSLVSANSRTESAARRLADLQLAATLLTGDLQQAAERPVRGAYGDPLPALGGERGRLGLTRAGHANPTAARRATLQRARWGVENGELVRWSWPVLDRTPASVPAERRLLDDVKDLHFRYRLGGEWLDAWPPEGSRAATAPILPRAVEFTLELGDWGTVTRVVLLPEGGP